MRHLPRVTYISKAETCRLTCTLGSELHRRLVLNGIFSSITAYGTPASNAQPQNEEMERFERLFSTLNIMTLTTASVPSLTKIANRERSCDAHHRK